MTNKKNNITVKEIENHLLQSVNQLIDTRLSGEYPRLIKKFEKYFESSFNAYRQRIEEICMEKIHKSVMKKINNEFNERQKKLKNLHLSFIGLTEGYMEGKCKYIEELEKKLEREYIYLRETLNDLKKEKDNISSFSLNQLIIENNND